MKIGTKSLLFGVHQVFLHPIFVFWGWYKLYGWPNWKEIVCIIIHDWGYWGCGDMDGREGENHSWWAAKVANYFLDPKGMPSTFTVGEYKIVVYFYAYLCLFHSRFFSKRAGLAPSKLYWADKLGTALMPIWLWVFLARLSGEVQEYLHAQKDEVLRGSQTPYEFFKKYKYELVPRLLRENGVIK